MITHTRAPWYVIGTNPPRVYARDGLDIIAQCDSGKEFGISQELANARLIAAAPEMLSLLCAIKSHLYSTGSLHAGAQLFDDDLTIYAAVESVIDNATKGVSK